MARRCLLPSHPSRCNTKGKRAEKNPAMQQKKAAAKGDRGSDASLGEAYNRQEGRRECVYISFVRGGGEEAVNTCRLGATATGLGPAH